MDFNLVEFDNTLKAIDKKELLYIYVMIVGGIIFLSYYFLFDMSEENLTKAIIKSKSFSREIREYKNYLSFHDEFEVNKLKANIESLKDSINMLKDKKMFISQKIQTLSNVIYNKESWTDFLKNISTIANSSGVEIYSIKNHFLTDKKLNVFQNHLKVEIKMNSNYINTLHFIDQIERSNLIVNVDSLKMNLTADGVSTEIFISIWGIKT